MDMKLYKKDSTLFLLPLWNKSRKELFNDNFITTYARDNRFPHLRAYIVTVYSKNIKSLDKSNIYGKNKFSDGKVFYYHELDREYFKDYDNFLEGNYSKFSNKAKEQIINFWDVNNYSLIYGILYKTSFAKKLYFNRLQLKNALNKDTKYMEYWRKPNLSKEIFSTSN